MIHIICEVIEANYTIGDKQYWTPTIPISGIFLMHMGYNF